jgi:hypothetical protein
VYRDAAPEPRRTSCRPGPPGPHPRDLAGLLAPRRTSFLSRRTKVGTLAGPRGCERAVAGTAQFWDPAACGLPPIRPAPASGEAPFGASHCTDHRALGHPGGFWNGSNHDRCSNGGRHAWPKPNGGGSCRPPGPGYLGSSTWLPSPSPIPAHRQEAINGPRPCRADIVSFTVHPQSRGSTASAASPCRPSCAARSSRQRFHFAWFRLRPAHVNGGGKGGAIELRACSAQVTVALDALRQAGVNTLAHMSTVAFGAQLRSACVEHPTPTIYSFIYAIATPPRTGCNSHRNCNTWSLVLQNLTNNKLLHRISL